MTDQVTPAAADGEGPQASNLSTSKTSASQDGLGHPRAKGGSWVRLVIIVAVLVVVAVVVSKSGVFAWNASDSAAIDILRERAQSMTEPQRGAALLVAAVFDEYRSIARMWSAVYNGCVLGAAALGLLAALVLKLESVPKFESGKKDAAAALASIGAILAALSSSGDFQMKWQTNRSAVADIERIAVRLMAPTSPNLDEVYVEVGAIAEERHLKLIGVQRSAERPARADSASASAPSGNDRAAGSGAARPAAGQASAPAIKPPATAGSTR